ncbi:probable E3 ubiquitin-protein ligase XERICO [Andrographis paniculata]|uniref:probable E3 ubiquitin-protein ligase XERICO n=1 Tax=Andrographis paniculata TaxID=175694 RepID=UPI0021E932FE|nr:probable E3 ubiquitin-protein ligase XERICO [Andrographis paniculata]
MINQDMAVKCFLWSAKICPKSRDFHSVSASMVVSDQFVLCKAALIFAVTRWILSFALHFLTTSLGILSVPTDSTAPASSGSSCCSSPSSSSASLRIVRDSLATTTLGSILPERQDMSCAVCLNRLRKNSKVCQLSNCSHVFHKHCLERWLSYDNRLTCPLCRASLVAVSSAPPAPQPSWAVERMLYLFGDDLLP